MKIIHLFISGYTRDAWFAGNSSQSSCQQRLLLCCSFPVSHCFPPKIHRNQTYWVDYLPLVWSSSWTQPCWSLPDWILSVRCHWLSAAQQGSAVFPECLSTHKVTDQGKSTNLSRAKSYTGNRLSGLLYTFLSRAPQLELLLFSSPCVLLNHNTLILKPRFWDRNFVICIQGHTFNIILTQMSIKRFQIWNIFHGNTNPEMWLITVRGLLLQTTKSSSSF